jgi:coenzyme F420 hydrogenase subunit beta
MGGEGRQWLIVRNARGQAMVDLLGEALRTTPVGSRGRRAGAVKGFIANTARAAGGLPLRAMPDWLRPLMGWLMPRVGPRGLEFARARLEMKAAETILHLRRAAPARMKRMIPSHVWALAAPYGLTPEPGETPPRADDADPSSRPGRACE